MKKRTYRYELCYKNFFAKIWLKKIIKLDISFNMFKQTELNNSFFIEVLRRKNNAQLTR